MYLNGPVPNQRRLGIFCFSGLQRMKRLMSEKINNYMISESSYPLGLAPSNNHLEDNSKEQFLYLKESKLAHA